MPAACVFAYQIARAVQKAHKFSSAIEFRLQRPPDNFGFWPVQFARPAVQPFRKLGRQFNSQRLHVLLVTPIWRIDNTEFRSQIHGRGKLQ